MPRGRPGRPECTAAGCQWPNKAHGLCQNHYRYVKRNANPEREIRAGRSFVRDETKLCRECAVAQPVDNFNYRTKGGRRYYRPYCATCQPSVVAAQRITRRYNISAERWAEMRKNGCAVCGSFDRLCVDHDHGCCPSNTSCGACVRGALCGPCNAADGMLGSDPDRVLSLVAYILSTRDVIRGAFA